jgi:hypothetical protein
MYSAFGKVRHIQHVGWHLIVASLIAAVAAANSEPGGARLAVTLHGIPQ